MLQASDGGADELVVLTSPGVTLETPRLEGHLHGSFGDGGSAQSTEA